MDSMTKEQEYSYWSENLHSSYLFYTLEVDKLNKRINGYEDALNAFNNDPYFDGLSYEAIAELAKKSIRLCKLNSELEDEVDRLTNQLEEVNDMMEQNDD